MYEIDMTTLGNSGITVPLGEHPNRPCSTRPPPLIHHSPPELDSDPDFNPGAWIDPDKDKPKKRGKSTTGKTSRKKRKIDQDASDEDVKYNVKTKVAGKTKLKKRGSSCQKSRARDAS